MSHEFDGGCLCGAVRFHATGTPRGVFWCHCQSCRRHSGAPVSVFVGFERQAYAVTKRGDHEVQVFSRHDARLLPDLRFDADLRS
jgi:hypothetical protein